MKTAEKTRVAKAAASLGGLKEAELHGERWFVIESPDLQEAFLMHVVSDWDHWVYVGSNGAITAGRVGPERALFPYYTQDKVFDMAGVTGGLTQVRVLGVQEERWWQPYVGEMGARPSGVRRLYKHFSGTAVCFEEESSGHGLNWQCLWGVSKRYGLLRRVSLRNTGDAPVDLEVVDGVQNLMPAGLDDQFQNHFSNLADAYKRGERLESGDFCLYYLNSIPTDRAEPSESLRATVVWGAGLEAEEVWLSPNQLSAFKLGAETEPEWEVRGRRFAYLKRARVHLMPGEEKAWWVVADVWKSASDITALLQELDAIPEPSQVLEQEWRQTAVRLNSILSGADALQHSAEALRNARHYSNTLYNVLRGGIFLHGYQISRDDFLRHVRHFNHPVAEAHCNWLESLPAILRADELYNRVAERGDSHLSRLAREYLPLVYSRRHGDPSRPWNRFRIELSDAAGRIRYGYQGNWRDIFQNWEALLHAYPDFIESTIYRFLNASTADGYNPYRITMDGFDWEIMDPAEPWSNIGYWGDHQLVYLLKLLEQSEAYHPGLLPSLLGERQFAYGHVPYRIRSFEDILSNPRSSIDYSADDAAAIAGRVTRLGSDGQLLPGPDGSPFSVCLAEKLLVPLLAKLSNLVPGGGIWMNTQRPEWNDANNALAGYGLSVVTLGYSYRYIKHLIRLFSGQPLSGAFEMSAAVVDWLEDQAKTLLRVRESGRAAFKAQERYAIVSQLGEGATRHRTVVYAGRLHTGVRRLGAASLLAYLNTALDVVAESLHANRRTDGLYHSYNILEVSPKKELHVHYLQEMLEGQVSILSSGLLQETEVVNLLQSLEGSALYEPRQQSYLLYPDRELPGFLQRNRIPEDQAARSLLLQRHLKTGCRSLVERDARGEIRFRPDFRNCADLERALDRLPDPEDHALAGTERLLLVQLYERTFGHDTFTGRSGSFFAYEGLGSIYWHMVSKLALAVLECRQRACQSDRGSAACQMLSHSYADIQRGLGLWKDPALYGAFPTDAYSHTPSKRGAQQPGMTGQVKEDILTRRLELGLIVRDGSLEFVPQCLSKGEFHQAPARFSYVNLEGAVQELDLAAGQLAFTVCQVPVVYSIGTTYCIEAILQDGVHKVISGPVLGKNLSASLFGRRGIVQQISVMIPESSLEVAP